MLRESKVRVVRFKPSLEGSKMGLDDFLVAEGRIGLEKLLEGARPALYSEIDDITGCSAGDRLHSLQRLFLKLACLEPVELEPYREYCLTHLGIPRRDFQAQLNRVKVGDARAGFIGMGTTVVEDKKLQIEDSEVRRQAMELLEDPYLL